MRLPAIKQNRGTNLRPNEKKTRAGRHVGSAMACTCMQLRGQMREWGTPAARLRTTADWKPSEGQGLLRSGGCQMPERSER